MQALQVEAGIEEVAEVIEVLMVVAAEIENDLTRENAPPAAMVGAVTEDPVGSDTAALLIVVDLDHEATAGAVWTGVHASVMMKMRSVITADS
jgi:hypothetical protein